MYIACITMLQAGKHKSPLVSLSSSALAKNLKKGQEQCASVFSGPRKRERERERGRVLGRRAWFSNISFKTAQFMTEQPHNQQQM